MNSISKKAVKGILAAAALSILGSAGAAAERQLMSRAVQMTASRSAGQTGLKS